MLIKSGEIFEYNYLWAWQSSKGETEGRKSRPSVIAVALPVGEQYTLLILPITSQPPVKGRTAIKIPQLEIKQAGLEAGKDLWIMLDEYNDDIYPGSYYFKPSTRKGQFSKNFTLRIMKDFLSLLKQHEVDKVSRTDKGDL